MSAPTRVHPSEAQTACCTARIKVDALIAQAEKRGDHPGAHEWRQAAKALEVAQHALDVARSRQDWSRSVERMPAPAKAAPKSAVLHGVVTTFNMDTLRGTVRTVDERDYLCLFEFHSTSFQSDTSMRWPRVGEPVTVVFNSAGDLLSVHGA